MEEKYLTVREVEIRRVLEEEIPADLEIKDILEDFQKDHNLIRLVVRLCKWLDSDSKALWEKIDDLSEDVAESIEAKLRRHRHLPDGTVVEPI